MNTERKREGKRRRKLERESEFLSLCLEDQLVDSHPFWLKFWVVNPCKVLYTSTGSDLVIVLSKVLFYNTH